MCSSAEVPSYYLLISNIWMSRNEERVIAATLSLFRLSFKIIVTRRQTSLIMQHLFLIWFELTSCRFEHVKHLEFEFLDISELVNFFNFKVFQYETLICDQYLARHLLKYLMIIQISRFNVRDPTLRELRQQRTTILLYVWIYPQTFRGASH